MGKKNGNSEKKAKKAPDVTMQKVRKARRCLKSSGKRGLERFLAQNADIRSHADVKALLQQAATLPGSSKPPKGKRGPKSPDQRQKAEAASA